MEKAARKALEVQLTQAINDVLNKADSELALSVSKHVKSAAKQIAKKFAKQKPEDEMELAAVSTVKSVSPKKIVRKAVKKKSK